MQSNSQRLRCLFFVACILHNAPALAVRADVSLLNCPPGTKLKQMTELSTCTSARLTASACYAKCIFIFCRAVHRARNYLSVITNLSTRWFYFFLSAERSTVRLWDCHARKQLSGRNSCPPWELRSLTDCLSWKLSISRCKFYLKRYTIFVLTPKLTLP